MPPASADAPRESATSALPSFIEEIERKAIEQALTDNRYNKTKAAAQLGITFRALRYKLKKLGSSKPNGSDVFGHTLTINGGPVHWPFTRTVTCISDHAPKSGRPSLARFLRYNSCTCERRMAAEGP